MKDYYLILKIPPQASAEEIRSAYRQRALELHPDVSGADSEPFLQLQEAYNVLADPATRAAYDGQSAPVSRRTRPPFGRSRAEPFREVTPAGAVRDISLRQSFDRFAPSFEEIFERLWSNFDSIPRPKAEHLESLTVDVPLSPDQGQRGGRVRVLVPVRAQCTTCFGSGQAGVYECWRCQGQGSVTAEFPLEISYPAGIRQDYIVRVPLEELGIQNLYLTVSFRVSAMAE